MPFAHPWLDSAHAALSELKIKLPAWSDPAQLQRPLVQGNALTFEETRVVLLALRVLSDEKLSGEGGMAASRTLLKELKKHSDAHSLDNFVWSLLEKWIAAEAPTKDNWAFKAVGQLGSDACAVKLTPLLLRWPEENQHKRAAVGLEVLDAINTETAMLQLNLLSKRAKSPALQRKAQAYMEAIAARNGMTTEDLEDRIIPTCGLDEHGRRTFDYGSRQFELLLGPELKPMLRFPDGVLKTSLPAITKKDDEAKASACKSDWAVLKKQIGDVVKLQTARLKNGMVNRRRWRVADFEKYCAKHPLMGYFTRSLLWAGYTHDGKEIPFRVSEEREYLDADENPVVLTGFKNIGVIHPAGLDTSVLQCWSQIFNDYNLISPFPQLGRTVHRVGASERDAKRIKRFAGTRVAGASLAYPLKNVGWVQNGDEMTKLFPESLMRAHLEIKGDIGSVFYDPSQPLEMGECYFTRAAHKQNVVSDNAEWKDDDDDVVEDGEELTLGTVDWIAFSETVHDLELVAAKAI